MPKVVIKEYDLTQAGRFVTNSFAVAIAGPVSDEIEAAKTGTYPDGFDENGIISLSTQSEFIKYVGKKAAKSAKKAIAPTLTEFTTTEKDEEGEFKVKTYGPISKADYFEKYTLLYTRAEDSSLSSIGFLVDSTEGEGGTPVYRKYTSVISTNESGEEVIADWNADTSYAMIMPGYEGQDEVTASSEDYNVANQMAYLLLGQGYQVYYIYAPTIEKLKDFSTYEPLLDKTIYDFRYIVHGLRKDHSAAKVANVNDAIMQIANNSNAECKAGNGRGDIIALLNISFGAYEGKKQSEAITQIKNEATGGNTYCAYFAPDVSYTSIAEDAYDNNIWMPASFHYLLCAAKAFSSYREWYAVSGYTRGNSDLSVSSTLVKLGDAAVQALQGRNKYYSGNNKAVNLVINLRGAYYLWGNRTADSIDGGEGIDGLTANNFLNVRQLCCTLKKAINTVCRSLMFDPNSEQLWTNFCNGIRPTLDVMKTNQGIKDYSIEKLDTTLKAKLYAAVRIIPIEAVEDFEIGVTLEDSLDGEVSITETYFGQMGD